MMNGTLITFEGVDGVGKSTHVDQLRGWLVGNDVRTEVCAEPGGTVLGRQIRKVLLPDHQPEPESELSSKAELLLFLAARVQLVKEKLRPWLREEENPPIVICDRSRDSTYAYQGFGRGCLDVDGIKEVEKLLDIDIKPDLTILLVSNDLVEISSRLHKRPTNNKYDSKDIKGYQGIQDSYKTLAAEEPDRFVVINADRTKKDIQSEIRQVLIDKGIVDRGFQI